MNNEKVSLKTVYNGNIRCRVGSIVKKHVSSAHDDENVHTAFKEFGFVRCFCQQFFGCKRGWYVLRGRIRT
jgi:hypothetical protein